MNSFFNWLKDPGTQGMLVLMGTICAFVAAFAAIYFGRKSLTKKDLARVEENTALSSDHLENVHRSLKTQEVREDFRAKIETLHFVISGQCMKDEQLPVKVTPLDESVCITHLDWFLGDGSFFGKHSCSKVGEGEYAALLPTRQMSALTYKAIGALEAPELQVRLRIHFMLDGQASYRDCPVTIYSMKAYIFGAEQASPGFQIEGSI